jgi:hypothetical protein
VKGVSVGGESKVTECSEESVSYHISYIYIYIYIYEIQVK